MSHQGDLLPDVSLEIAPRLSNLALIRKIVNSLSVYMGFSEDKAMQLEMAVDEACSNSIASIQEKEGDPPQTKVRIEICFHEHCLRLAIIDGGDDFSEEFALAVPFHEHTDRTRKRGYGLQIIKTFVDEAHHVYEPSLGNKLILTKYLRDDL